MNKIFSKVIGASLAIAMMIGVGAGVSASKAAKEVNAAGTTYSISDMDGSYSTSGGSVELTNNNLSITWTYGTSTYIGYSGGKIQVGSKKNPQTSAWTLSAPISAFGNNKKVTSVSMSAYTTATSATYDISVGGSSAKSGSLTTSNATYTANSLAATSGDIELTLTGSSTSKAMYLCGISVVFEDNSALPETYYDITYVSNGGTDVSADHVVDDNNTPVVRPSDPEKTGYVFAGWYEDPQFGGDAYDFDAAVTHDLTLYAKWEKVALTQPYSAALLSNNTGYRVSGQVTFRSGASDFFIQDGNSAIQINNSALAEDLSIGDTVDLYGTYTSNNGKIGNVLYSTVTRGNGTITQTPLTSLDDATAANRHKYFEIPKIQLNSAFNSNNQATIKNSNVIVWYQAASFVNLGDQVSFNKNNFAANDFVSVKGVINTYNTTVELQISHIQKFAQYTVAFDANVPEGANATATPSQTVIEGDTATQPSNPTRESDESNNYTFGGWYETPGCDGDPFDFDTPITQALTLYAKWNASPIPASQVIPNLNTQSSLTYNYLKEGEAIVDTLTYSSIGVTGTNYTDWEDLQDESSAVYFGKTSGSSSSIQLNDNNRNPGIVTTVSGGNAKKITVVWNSGTANGKTLQVYGKNTAYEAVTDLYDANKKGTLIGSIVKGTDTVLEIENDYAYIGFFATGSLNLDSIKIQWGEESFHYSGVGIRFTGTISTTLWNRLNSESTILGYGIMYATAQWCDNASIEDWYGIARTDETNVDDTFTAVQNKSYKMVKGTEIKSFYTPISVQKPNPAQVGDVYGWSLFKNIAEEDLATPYTGVAYIRTENDEIIFLNEITKSVADLAQDLIDADNEYNATSLDGSLKDLADKA